MTNNMVFNQTRSNENAPVDRWITVLLYTSITLYMSLPVLTCLVKHTRVRLATYVYGLLQSNKALPRVKKAFSADPEILADHGVVRAPLMINYKTNEVGIGLVGRDVEPFTIVFGSGASLDNPVKGINPSGAYLSYSKIGQLTGEFTEDIVECFNDLWAHLFALVPSASEASIRNARFNTSRPGTYKSSYESLLQLIAECQNSDSKALPSATDDAVQELLKNYIDSLLTLVRYHLGSVKAFEVRAAMDGAPRWGDSSPSLFLHQCTNNLYTKPSALVRDFSQLIGWQPIGGFVLDSDSPYHSYTKAIDAVVRHVPIMGDGVLSLCEGISLNWAGVSGCYRTTEKSILNSDPLSVHWYEAGNSEIVTGTIISCEARHVGTELANELIACGSVPSDIELNQLVAALKDPYVVRLRVAAGANCSVEVRYGNVHFSSESPDAENILVPAILTMAEMYSLHALGGDTNVTASKERNGLDIDYVVDVIKKTYPHSIVHIFPHPITKTRRAGDLLMNSQTLTKYGTSSERDGMIAIAFK